MRSRASLGAAFLTTTALFALTATSAAQPAPTGPQRCHHDAKPPPVGPAPRPSDVLSGSRRSYVPFVHFDFGPPCVTLDVPLSAALRLEPVSSIPVDGDGNRLARRTFASPEVRVGAIFDTARSFAPWSFHVEYEHDLLTGISAADPSVDGAGLPAAEGLSTQLRKAYVRASLGTIVHATVGLNTSHWGLGLLANDGDHGWEPGSARFADPRGGDRVARAAFATGPHTDLKLFAFAGADLVVDDDVLLTDDEADEGGDEAKQVVAGLVLGQGEPTWGGAYVARRRQETVEGRVTEVWAIDVAGRYQLVARVGRLALEGEVALVTGTTGLAPTPSFPEHDVLQLGAAARATFDRGAFGAALDLLYASGDRNPDDGAQNAFRADPNYEVGLLLYRHVLASQSGRGARTAGDPDLVGYPSEDLDRISTRGGATNTLAVFPRLRYRFIDGLEAYGGPLFAFAPVAWTDPFRTRLAGGAPRNALGGESGSSYGVEYDLGLRYRAVLGGAEMTAGLEAGLLRPRDALTGPAALRGDDTIYGGRMMLRFRL